MPSAQTAKSSGKKEAGLTVITPPALAIYAYVWKPRPAMTEGREMQYSVVLVFPKNTDLSKLKAAARLAAERKWGSKRPSGLKNPFRSGNEARPDDPIFQNATFITARTTQKPGIVDQDVQPILDEMDFYSGCTCRASVYAHAFDQKGSKGVSFLLNNIQKLKDGTRLSGRKPAEDEFDSVEGGKGNTEDDDLDDDIPF